MIYRMRLELLVTAVVLTAMTAAAQARHDCMAGLDKRSATRGTLGYPRRQWDPQRTYRQPVVLISFEDCDFMVTRCQARCDN